MLRPALFLAATALLALPACAAEAPRAEARASEARADALDLALDLARIVTIGGPVTETVYALGLGDRVVGADRSSLYPEAVLALPRLDYFRQTSAEGVLSLRPTVVLAVEGTGPPGVAEQIRSAGVPVVVLGEPTSMAAAEARVERLGRLLGRASQADSLIGVMRRDVAAAETPAAAPRALFVYARGARVVLASGVGNAADAMLRLAGAENAVSGYEGFRPLTAEAAAKAAPDVIVVPAAGLESLGGTDALVALPGLAQTPAGRSRRVVAVDDALVLGFGPRVGQGVRALAEGLASEPVAAR